MSSLLIWILFFGALSLTAAYIFIPQHKHKYAFITAAFLALLIRFAMVLYLYRGGTDTFGTDGLLYHNVGIWIAEQLNSGVSIFEVKYPYTWYTVFIGIIYHIFGVHRHIASFINAFLAFASGILLFRIALKRKYSFENAAFISLVFLYFPNLFLWTTDTRKEALVILVTFLIWYILQHFTTQESGSRSRLTSGLQLIAVCFLIWFATILRIYLFIPIVAGILLTQLLQYRKTRDKACLVWMAAVTVSTIIICILTVYPLVQNHHAMPFPESETEDMAENVYEKITILEGIALNRDIPLAVANYLTLPRPGNVDIADIRGMKSVIFLVRLDMAVWYGCLLLMAIGIYTAAKKRDSCFIGILAYLAVYVLINALLVENNSGTIYRYRSQIVGLFLLFIDWSAIRDILGGIAAHVTAGVSRGQVH